MHCWSENEMVKRLLRRTRWNILFSMTLMVEESIPDYGRMVKYLIYGRYIQKAKEGVISWLLIERNFCWSGLKNGMFLLFITFF